MFAIRYYFHIYVCVCATYVHVPTQTRSEVVRSPGLALISDCKLPTLRSGNQTPVLWKRKKCSQPLTYLSSPRVTFDWAFPSLLYHLILITHKSIFFSTLSFSSSSSTFGLSSSLIALKNTHSSTNITVRVVVLLLQGLIQVASLWSHSVVAKLASQEGTRKKAQLPH